MRDLRLGMEEFFQYLPVFLRECHLDLKDVKGNVRLSEAGKGEHLHGIFSVMTMSSAPLALASEIAFRRSSSVYLW